MRSVAPESPGRAASQNSWSVVKLKPTSGSLATTTDHTCHTAKESRRAGIEIQRLRRAMRRPVLSQNAGSSGRQSLRVCPICGATTGLGKPNISGNGGSFARTSPAVPRSMCRMLMCVHRSATATRTNNAMKQLVHRPVRSKRTPNRIVRRKPPSPPIMPTRPPTEPR